MKIDINCDMGESYGAFTIGRDDEVVPFVSSLNIACGFHGGDPQTMHRTIQLAKKQGAGVGAHPGFRDLQGFGRREMKVSSDELYHDMIYQIGALQAFAQLEGVSLQHVKPHGALYNMVQKDRDMAHAVVEAIYDVNPQLRVFGLPNSVLLQEAEKKGLPTAREFFADRTFLDDGTLTPRSRADAVLHDPEQVVPRVIRLVQEHEVVSVTGKTLHMEADTVCIHGDGAHALDFARSLYQGLKQAGIDVMPVGNR